MKLITTQAHQGEGQFPTFAKGSLVEALTPCRIYSNWFSCKINGIETYIVQDFIEEQRLNCDYNPTELVVQQGEIVELLALYYQWAFVKKSEKQGWLPCEILKMYSHEIFLTIDFSKKEIR